MAEANPASGLAANTMSALGLFSKLDRSFRCRNWTFASSNTSSRSPETGSVREAASRVRVAQSALSRHVRSLENELGVTLFERHARGVTLTPGRRPSEGAGV